VRPLIKSQRPFRRDPLCISHGAHAQGLPNGDRFHDAYIAAPSQKAALAAWGSEANLFGLGMAELVTDEALTKQPLETPGKVIKLPRGSAEEHYAALPKSEVPKHKPRKTSNEDEPSTKTNGGAQSGIERRDAKARSTPVPPKTRPAAKPKPRPSRTKLDAAEQALEQAEADYRTAVDEIRERERELQRQRHQLEERHEELVARLEEALTKADDRYRTALNKWRGS
jgi:hypothetical protein